LVGPSGGIVYALKSTVPVYWSFRFRNVVEVVLVVVVSLDVAIEVDGRILESIVDTGTEEPRIEVLDKSEVKVASMVVPDDLG
jgi:hypothetical protein